MMHPHPFRFGLLGQSVRSATELVETARRAEGAGFATFLLRDHFIAEPFGHQLAPLAALATAAAATATLRVGSLCSVTTTATLCSSPRKSPRSTWCQAAGLSWGSGRASRDRSMRRPGCRMTRPACVSAVSPRRSRLSRGCSVLRRSREADIIGIQTATLGTGRQVPDPTGLLAETIAEKIDWVRQEAGTRFANLELSIVGSVIITENRREAAERLVHARGWEGLSADKVFEMPSIFIGSVDQIVNEMQGRRERYGISYYVVPDSSLEMVAPIVARLAGV